MSQQAAKAGPIVVVRDDTEKGPVLQLIAIDGDRAVRIFNLYQTHLCKSPEALDLIENFISEARGMGAERQIQVQGGEHDG